ncbi:MAG: hypothetical protein WC527_06565 [Candidatus Margulisiibacteriota bacterium]
MDKKQALLERNKISRLLGTETADDNLERNIFLLQSLERQKDIANIIGRVCELIKEGQKDSGTFKDIKSEIGRLIDALNKYQEVFSKELKVSVNNFPPAVSEVKVSNLEDFKQEHPKEIRVSNLKEIKPEKHPEEVSVKKPVWYKEFDFKKLFKLAKDSNESFFKQVKTTIFNGIIKNIKPKEAIPVRLVTEDGERFYRAGNVYVGGGSDSAVLTELRKLIGFEIPAYDYIALTYVSSGDGRGEIETVTYKKGGVSGATVAALTLAYNADNEIETITRA